MGIGTKIMNDKEIELQEEARQEEMHEHYMENDYDYFIKNIYDDIEALNSTLEIIRYSYNAYGWEFDIDEVLE
jgi:tRNA A37 threonylcarbamoyladenosine dehydratase